MLNQNNTLSLTSRLIYASLIGILCSMVFYTTSAMSPALTPLNLPFSWESAIPFLEWMVIPYLSLYILFFLAFSLCRDKAEMIILCKQACFVVLVSAVCFFLLPAKFSFDKPAMSDITGHIIGFLQLDQPYSQFPSMHTALSLVIWQVFNNHCKPNFRRIVFIWFSLLVASNIFFYQHHFLDIIGALVTACLAMYFFPAVKRKLTLHREHSVQHIIIGLAYFLPALSLVLLGCLMQGWFLLLLYPGICFGLISLAYFRADADFTQKRQGRFPWWIVVLFLPYLVCIKNYWRLYAHSSRPWIRINSGIIIGRTLANDEWPSANDLGITTVLDLSPEISDRSIPENVDYIYMPLLDNVPPSKQDLDKICKQIGESYLEGTIFIHCNLGNDRCLTVLTAYLAAQNNDLIQSMEIVQKFKPNFDLPAYYLKSLWQFTNPTKENHLLERDTSSSHRALT